RTVELVGARVAELLRDTSIRVFTDAAGLALERGLILADTKFEFGADVDGALTLADEVLTPDSSRYWDLAEWNAGERGSSFDKQVVRNWLLANWDGHGTPPDLPASVVADTASRYRELAARFMD